MFLLERNIILRLINFAILWDSNKSNESKTIFNLFLCFSITDCALLWPFRIWQNQSHNGTESGENNWEHKSNWDWWRKHTRCPNKFLTRISLEIFHEKRKNSWNLSSANLTLLWRTFSTDNFKILISQFYEIFSERLLSKTCWETL